MAAKSPKTDKTPTREKRAKPELTPRVRHLQRRAHRAVKAQRTHPVGKPLPGYVQSAYQLNHKVRRARMHRKMARATQQKQRRLAR